MERSAAALKAGGNTLNESIALITAGNLIQQDADTTANALKVMSLRIRGSKAELEAMGEETDTLADSTSKLRDEIKALTGVDIMLDDDTYKSTTRIIQEIGAVFDKLTDVSQATVLEKLAGKTRSSTVAGLLENYEVIAQVMETAANAEGSAQEEMSRYMETIDAHYNQLLTKWAQFWDVTLDTDVVIAVIDALTNLLDKGIEAGGLLGVLGDLLPVLAIFKGSGRPKMFGLKYAAIIMCPYRYISFHNKLIEIQ